MMVVLPAVAHNSALARTGEQESESDDSAQTPAEEAGASATEEAESSEGATPATKPKRRARPQVAQESREESRDTGFGGPAQLNHLFQTGLSIMPGSGYRLIVPYKDGQYCADSSGVPGKAVCSRAVPIFLDFQLAFGATTRVDIILDLRFGVQSDALMAGSHQFGLAPGLRFWLDQEVALKFYTTLQFAYNHLDFKNSGPSDSDYGVRNANGLMYDPIRNVGFFVQFGESVGVARWFSIELDVGVGAQIRFP